MLTRDWLNESNRRQFDSIGILLALIQALELFSIERIIDFKKASYRFFTGNNDLLSNTIRNVGGGGDKNSHLKLKN